MSPFISNCSLRRMVTVRPQAALRLGPTEHKGGIKIVGCGSCGVDYLASVAAFPHPDQKLRTDALEVQGGGNCANALTAAARLGLRTTIVSKIGGDGLGDEIISELLADGIDTSLLLRADGQPSPFTYIIVDRAGGTRTCIHTPGAAFDPSEMNPGLISSALQGASLVYFDGRLTEAALLLAQAARQAGIPVLVEGERLRPGLMDLLQQADYVVTSAHFPQELTGEASLGDALLSLASRLPRARLLFTTQGARGSICLERQADVDQKMNTPLPSDSLEHILEDLFSQVNSQQQQPGASSSPACVSTAGTEVMPARVSTAPGPMQLHFSGNTPRAAVATAAQEAAQKAAMLNADVGRAEHYAGDQGGSASCAGAGAAVLVARVTAASAAGLPAGAVVDTTGAGDAFIGSILYGITAGMDPQQMMGLAAAVAACKCTALGARPGLPNTSQLAAEMLQTRKQETAVAGQYWRRTVAAVQPPRLGGGV